MASNQTFIVAAYSLTWVVMLVYVIRLVRKSARARAEYARVNGARSAGGQS